MNFSLRIRLYVLRIRDFRTIQSYCGDGIETFRPPILFDPGGVGGFLGFGLPNLIWVVVSDIFICSPTSGRWSHFDEYFVRWVGFQPPIRDWFLGFRILCSSRKEGVHVIPCNTCSQWPSFTLQGTNISPQNGILKMIFLFPRWDMLIPWRVNLWFF